MPEPALGGPLLARASVAVLALLALVPVLVTTDTTRSDLAAGGAWTHPGAWEEVPGVPRDERVSQAGHLHATVLPTGKVLLFALDDTWLFDPATRAFEGPIASPNVIFCAGLAMLGDGRLFVAGGDRSDNPGRGDESALGLAVAQAFDPWEERWVELAPMAERRWYPTAVTLADGRVAVFTGSDGARVATDVEVYDPARDAWTKLGARLQPLYERAHLMPDGGVWSTGPREATVRWDPATGAFEELARREGGHRYGGASVLLDAARGTVLVFGGHGGDAAGELLDASGKAWKTTGALPEGRGWSNGVLLPTGDVLGVGGERKPSAGPLPSVGYDAALGVWREVATPSYPRPYHSLALLLPDGSVLATGPTPTLELYRPWYFFAGPRPVIEDAPARLGYGERFAIAAPDAAGVERAVLVRLAGATHNLNTDQRLVELRFAATGAARLEARAPAEDEVAPPGYYMLFLLDRGGVPSEARLLQLQP